MKFTHTLLSALCLAMLPGLATPAMSEDNLVSGIYVGGHIRRERPGTITKLRESGFTYALLFNVHVDSDGTLMTDGETICKNGQYVFDKTQPHYVEDIRLLKTPPTSISRIEIVIGGWGNDSYNHIQTLINKSGTGRTTMLYRNFKALLETVPGIDAVNNDDEQCYDVSTATKFHVMMYDLGCKTTLAPYTYQSFWNSLATNINKERPGAVDRVMVQCYDGGAYNNPSTWNFPGITRHAGRLYYQDDWNFTKYTDKLEEWKQSGGATGAFMWVYNDETWDLNKYATAMNRIYGARTVADDEAVAWVYTEQKYGGMRFPLPVGTHTKADLAVYGIADKSIASVEVAEGYRVKMYKSNDCTSSYFRTDKSRPALTGSFSGNISSVSVELLDDAVDAIDDAKVGISMREGVLHITNALGHNVSIYNASGRLVFETPISGNQETLSLSPLPSGIYVVRVGKKTLTISI